MFFRVVPLLLCLIPGSLLAQAPLYFPANQFGQAHLRMPQNVLIQESSFNAVPNFEPVADFTASNRYRRLSQPIGRLDILVEHRTTGEQQVDQVHNVV